MRREIAIDTDLVRCYAGSGNFSDNDEETKFHKPERNRALVTHFLAHVSLSTQGCDVVVILHTQYTVNCSSEDPLGCDAV